LVRQSRKSIDPTDEHYRYADLIHQLDEEREELTTSPLT
jgi:hypothetical protein